MKVILLLQSRLDHLDCLKKFYSNKKKKEPLVELVLKRISLAKKIDKVVVAIPKIKKDDLLYKFLRKKAIRFFRGEETDALDRFFNAAKKYKADIVVRVTSDCALIDPKVIDKCVDVFLKKPDYLSNRFNLDNNIKKYSWAYPDGFDTEVFSFKLLKYVQRNHKKIHRVEGGVITPFFKQNPKMRKKFVLVGLNSPKLLKQHPQLSIDTKKDLALVKKIYKHFSPSINFSWTDVVNFLNLEKKEKMEKGPILWSKAQRFILNGNILVSKNPDIFLPNKWPTYYKKTKGCNIWDLNNKKIS